MLDELRISDLIKRLEELKDCYGDVRIRLHSTGGQTEFAEEVFITNFYNGKGSETVVMIS